MRKNKYFKRKCSRCGGKKFAELMPNVYESCKTRNNKIRKIEPDLIPPCDEFILQRYSYFDNKLIILSYYLCLTCGKIETEVSPYQLEEINNFIDSTPTPSENLEALIDRMDEEHYDDYVYKIVQKFYPKISKKEVGDMIFADIADLVLRDSKGFYGKITKEDDKYKTKQKKSKIKQYHEKK